MEAAETLVTHRGGCHCGRVRFEVDAVPKPRVLDCNCSMCSKVGFLHLIVPKIAFRLKSGEDDLTGPDLAGSGEEDVLGGAGR